MKILAMAMISKAKVDVKNEGEIILKRGLEGIKRRQSTGGERMDGGRHGSHR